MISKHRSEWTSFNYCPISSNCKSSLSALTLNRFYGFSRFEACLIFECNFPLKMIAANVLCIKKKKKKKKAYVSNLPDTIPIQNDSVKGQKTGTMLHITEDTPADMLSGAMDLTIHLPSSRTVKMCVERSTPMMDLLVQITTKHQLQITNHTLQPLQTVPNGGHLETVLSYYPNTPIGTLDTQQIRVVPKTRSLLIPKNVPPGHQPFESTFRLKVHLPRNQLYVTRVSRHVYIEDIMKKVCEEKNLDEKKYEVRHPGNLDEVLDAKLTLNDYMITEIYMVLKGSNSLTQGFTSSDIMATKKEEDRKQTHNRNSGGVFNLIFRRGRSNTGSGTISTTANSTHSNNVGDFVAPETTVATNEVPTTVKVDLQREKPRPPQRKRRPAPKPPQKVEPEPREPSETRISTVNSDNSTGDSSVAKNESGVTICHSRHSSDSSGYHETSILSDNCNTTLPRRSRLEEGDVTGHALSRRSESTGNLTKMSAQSRSTSSLAFPGRKKKTAPPPPKRLIKLSASSDTNFDKPSPVVASRTPSSSPPLRTDLSLASQESQLIPPSVPRRRKAPVPAHRPKSSITLRNHTEDDEKVSGSFRSFSPYTTESIHSCPYNEGEYFYERIDTPKSSSHLSTTDILKSLEYLNLDDQGNEIKPPEIISATPKSNQTIEDSDYERESSILTRYSCESVSSNSDGKFYSSDFQGSSQFQKTKISKEFSVTSYRSDRSIFEERELTRWGSCEELNWSPTKCVSLNDEEVSLLVFNNNLHHTCEEIASKHNDENVEDTKEEILSENPLCNTETQKEEDCSGNLESKCNDYDNFSTTESISSNGPSQNTQNKLDLILENSTESITNQKEVLDENNRTNDFCSISDTQKIIEQLNEIDTFLNYEKSSQDSGNSSDISEKSKLDEEFINVPISDTRPDDEDENDEWQLPSPPKAFKDCSPDIQKQTEMTEVDNVLNSELLEKLRKIEENEKTEYFLKDQANMDNIGIEQDDKVILNKLSLENLEKRKSLVYNRELSTSFRAYDSETPNENNLVKKFLSDLDLKGTLNRSDKLDEKSSTIKKSSTQSTLPNFRITTYDEPKQKIKVFEDDTIRSNSQDTQKSFTLDRTKSLQKTFIGRSMENISMKPQYSEEKPVELRDREHRIYNPKNHYTKRSINRTGSFSTYQNEWIPSKPITRSKSQVGVKRDEHLNDLHSGNLSKSNSLFDVSGLQSLEVMRKIQNKLNTPTASKETLAESEIEREHEKKQISEAEEVPLRKFQYTGPPSVNMSTWSERPKIPVCVKEDSDYKLGRGTSKTNFEITSNIQNVPLTNNIVEIRHTSDSKLNMFPNKTENENVTININGYEPIISQKNNVVIKIEQQTKRFQEFDTPFQYRAPLNSLNKNSPRPHSVAFSSDFDISRVPVVRSVELKKTYQETNHSNGNYQFSKSRYSSKDENSGNTTRPVFRTRSFLQPNPVVKGFRNFVSETKINNNDATITNRSSLTLPNPTSKNYSTNQSVPFSKFNLRRIESDKFSGENNIQTRISVAQTDRNGNCSEYFKEEPKSNDFVPQQPQMPKLVPKKIVNRQFVPVLDPRDELLKSIRDFGGKKGLRSRKA